MSEKESIWYVMQRKKGCTHEWVSHSLPKHHSITMVQDKVTKFHEKNSDVEYYEFIIYDSIWIKKRGEYNLSKRRYNPDTITIDKIKEVKTFTINKRGI